MIMIIISLQQQQKQHQQISQLKLVSVKHKQNKKLTEYFCWHCNNQEHLRHQHLLIKTSQRKQDPQASKII